MVRWHTNESRRNRHSYHTVFSEMAHQRVTEKTPQLQYSQTHATGFQVITKARLIENKKRLLRQSPRAVFPHTTHLGVAPVEGHSYRARVFGKTRASPTRRGLRSRSTRPPAHVFCPPPVFCQGERRPIGERIGTDDIFRSAQEATQIQ